VAARFAALCLLVATEGMGATDLVLQGRAKVVDGDTLLVNETSVRLFGIDAPEFRQSCTNARGASYACGRAAKQALIDLIGGAVVRCRVQDIDRYQRHVAVCFRDSNDLNAALVRSGWALAYRQYGMDYVGPESSARDAKRGLWAGTFEAPWRWRHRQQRRDAAAAQPSPGCRIKGNINARGDRIYHLPGQRFYAATQINPANGERFFCTEADARAAGWRRSEQ
jgi:endonuclease YncB( thermonuclease family)